MLLLVSYVMEIPDQVGDDVDQVGDDVYSPQSEALYELFGA